MSRVDAGHTATPGQQPGPPVEGGLVVRNLSCSYRKHRVLHEVNVALPQRGLTLLLGPNGAGKTTLIRCILGQTPYSGSITWNGSRIDPDRRQVFPVPGDGGFSLRATGYRNLALLGFDVDTTSPRYLSASQLRRPVSEFSSGQRKRLALMAAFQGSAEVLLLDEPHDSLDQDGVEALRGDLHRMSGNRAILVTCHTQDLVLYESLVNHTILLADGSASETPGGRLGKDGEREDSDSTCHAANQD